MQNLKIKKIFIFLTVLPIFLSANGKAQKTVALTFDDGPHPMVTEEIIDILNKYEVPATFFMVGLMVEKHPGIARKVYSGGFEIGNHTYSDTRLTSMSPAEIRSALTSFEEILKRKLGVRSSYFRPPGGRYNQAVLDIAREEGLNVVMWTRLVKDTSKNITAEKIYNLATRNPDEREIILLHDGPAPTLRALPGIIKYYKSHGYKFVPVSSLTPPLFKNIEVASKVSLFKNGAYLSGKVMAGKNLNEDTTHFAGVMVFFVGAGSLLFLFKFKNYKGSPPHDKISLIFLGGDIEKMKLIAETFSKREEKTTFFLTAEELQNLDVGLKQFLLENKHGIAYY
nr:polysaccharide deacetylase family protein [Elusimicrobiota bacterium]